MLSACATGSLAYRDLTSDVRVHRSISNSHTPSCTTSISNSHTPSCTTSQHFYKSRPVFDEAAILAELNPALHSELVQHILASTLGRLPLFSRCDPDFFERMFQFVKPLSCDPGEVIFRKGSASKDLLFLLSGSVDVLSTFNDSVPIFRISPGFIESIVLENRTSSLSSGVFGQSVLLGHRRPATYIAHTSVECMMIERPDIEKLFALDPRGSRRFGRMVLREYEQQVRDDVSSTRSLNRLSAVTTIWPEWHYSLSHARSFLCVFAGSALPLCGRVVGIRQAEGFRRSRSLARPNLLEALLRAVRT